MDVVLEEMDVGNADGGVSGGRITPTAPAGLLRE
jgi:hypothetical protein